jgi:predicted amidohydrolase
MKICIAQTRPIQGNISANIEAHKKFIEFAVALNADAIFFPELSLTGYEPQLAKQLASHQNDHRLDIFQEQSDKNKIIIGLGLPTETTSHVRISMIIFEPHKTRSTYSKQELHTDENPYFEKGHEQIIIQTEQRQIAPAICYESLQHTHAEKAFKLGADIYLASVAKHEIGVEKAGRHYSGIAKKYAMTVMMANCVGLCDNFVSVGRSAVWTKKGALAGQLDDKTEGILMFDTVTEEVTVRKM